MEFSTSQLNKSVFIKSFFINYFRNIAFSMWLSACIFSRNKDSPKPFTSQKGNGYEVHLNNIQKTCMLLEYYVAPTFEHCAQSYVSRACF